MKSKLLYERALITCVLMLIVSIILKLFGVPWFNLDTSIPILNKIDDIVMNSDVLSFVYSFISLFINGYLVGIITTKISNVTKYIVPLTVVCFTSIWLKTYIGNDILSFSFDTLGLLSVCIFVTNLNVSLKEYVLVFLLNIFYQIISAFIKALSINISYNPLMIGVLMNIDYYIMLVITYLYLKKGDTNLCLEFRRFGSSLANLLWKKPTQNSNQCSSKES